MSLAVDIPFFLCYNNQCGCTTDTPVYERSVSSGAPARAKDGGFGERKIHLELDYFFFYLEASVFCIAVLVILLIHNRRYSTREEKQIWFNRTIMAHILYLLSDIGWAAVIGGYLPRTRPAVVFFNLTNYVLLSLMAYDWLMYTAASLDLKNRNHPKKRYLFLLPLAVSVLILMTAYAMSPYFWVSEDGELTAWYYPMFIAAPVLYLTAACVLSLRKARKTHFREERMLFRLIGYYPMGVLAFGLVQTYLLKGPLFCFGCTIMLLSFYIQHMQTLVSVDSLTRMNNRGQIDRYMDQVKYSDGIQTYAVMLDVNRFKQINDTFGHAEGDRALILVSRSLKQMMGRSGQPGFLGRYGGDEFTIFFRSPEKDWQPEQAIGLLRELLREKQQENGLPYTLEITAGYDLLRNREDTLEECLARADQKLYEEKRRAGTLR